MITLAELANLPLSARLKYFLNNQLIEQPFGHLEAATEVWQQLDNRLIVFDRKRPVNPGRFKGPTAAHR